MGLREWWGRRPSRTSGDVPSWVQWFQDIARPVVAAIILVMCAPGEHHLAVMAGWSDRLAWGMPGCIIVYTGLAAVVATKREKGARGKRTAVAGAVLSLALAASAQPVSHLFVTAHWVGDPVALVVVVSCIPPLVMGHLWHLAASPSRLSVPVRDEQRTTVLDDIPVPAALVWDKSWDTGTQDGTADVPIVVRPTDPSRPEWLYDENGIRPEVAAMVRDSQRTKSWLRPETPDDVPVRDDRRTTAPIAVPDKIGPDTDLPDGMKWIPLAPRNVRDGSASSIALNALALNPDATDADLRDIVLRHLPEAKPDTVRKAVYRARRAA